MKKKVLLILILILAFCLRLVGFTWDSGYHFHPDERMLIMVAERIQFWSNLNPDFFNYGSLPLYLLKGTSQLIDLIFNSTLSNYDGMLIIGRILSTSADMIVVYLVFLISSILLRDKKSALWASFFYAIAFFPIQNSHFFIVDTFLNLFATLLVYSILTILEKPSNKKIVLLGITYAAVLTTKVSGLILLPIIIFVLIMPPERKNLPQLSSLIRRGIKGVVLFSFSLLVFSFLFMPYGFIKYEKFLSDILQQIKMNSDAYIFPYTLQYVGTTAYLYYLKNIFLWGLGPMISIFTICGIIFSIPTNLPLISSLRRRGMKGVVKLTIANRQPITFCLFYLVYFAIIGRSAVKFMRYMLLMYPFFAIMAGYGIVVILNLFQDLIIHVIPDPNRKSIFFSRFRIKSGMTMIIILPTLLWTFMFLNIYSKPNTRIQATEWINQFIPYGSTLAVEHWDDRVPIYDSGKYTYEELPLYDIPDDDVKWKMINEKLRRTDYIVIASNRLYAPLQRLNNCEETYPRCYPITAKYYEKLLDNKLGFVKIAEFSSYPTLHVLRYTFRINDDGADESFTVYDHPKIMIYKNTNN